MSSDSQRIPLRVANKTAYVWDVDDIAALRSKHNICGILIGTLPRLSQQNVFLGVPLVLMPEEAVLLVENEIAVLVDDPQAHPQPTIEQLKRWDSQQQEAIGRQISFAEAKGAKESTASGRAMSEEALQKRKEREERKLEKLARMAEAGASSDTPLAALVSEEVEQAPMPRPQTVIPVPGSPISKSTSIPHSVVIPAASSSFEWYNPSAYSYTTIAAAKAAGIWDYPATLQERARCGVFRGLWEQGYFMGGGIKFGGDYLVYPGDPLRYHSHFAASVLESPTASLRPMEIIAHGRLGTATKKAHLLCSWDDEKEDVSYLSIEWAGFG